ncbi:hypothetical protein G5S35_22400 [Paraburkholderia tropica]|uniref:hypothetical protein n=1 Tax=Paraburkholderia tropica TaxID=92647 RepID=UPI0015FF7B5A|nr:hypothetical protein [Paraburkholderia tropica]QNB14292.1 hypothetical protein G5S35_22400 [Paraburkholderia tropica]
MLSKTLKRSLKGLIPKDAILNAIDALGIKRPDGNDISLVNTDDWNKVVSHPIVLAAKIK